MDKKEFLKYLQKELDRSCIYFERFDSHQEEVRLIRLQYINELFKAIENTYSAIVDDEAASRREELETLEKKMFEGLKAEFKQSIPNILVDG